jgi:flavin reductase (DIM6/NTAB) family NADH-FMN oxidoreductase RutF
MIEISCSVGDRIRVGDQGMVEIVAVQGKVIQIHVTANQKTHLQMQDASPVQDGFDDFRHSE